MAERRPSDEIALVGGEGRVWGDWYQAMLRAPWWFTVAAIASTFLFLNLLFAIAFQIVDGVAGAHSFADRFFFSVQTMGTIGYGAMYPTSMAAHVLTTLESITSLLVIALSTGLVFSKFSMVRARVRFSEAVVIGPMNGVPTLMFRVGNQRESRVIDAFTRVSLSRRELTHEGAEMWRLYDLALERDRAPALSRAWLIMHRIVESSPLHGCTAESLASAEVELIVAITGIDETSGQTLHAQRMYDDKDVRWNVRYVDMLTRTPAGKYTLDLDRFDDVMPWAALGPARAPE